MEQKKKKEKNWKWQCDYFCGIQKRPNIHDSWFSFAQFLCDCLFQYRNQHLLQCEAKPKKNESQSNRFVPVAHRKHIRFFFLLVPSSYSIIACILFVMAIRNPSRLLVCCHHRFHFYRSVHFWEIQFYLIWLSHTIDWLAHQVT